MMFHPPPIQQTDVARAALRDKPNPARSQSTRLRVAAALMMCGLALFACASKPSLVGKWEKLYGSDLFGEDGTVIEFSGNGNVNLTLYGALGVAGRYSLSGDDHVKVQAGNQQAFEFEFLLNGDELTLIDPELDSNAVFAHYQELTPGAETLAGEWQYGKWDADNNCFGGLGLETRPERMTLGGDGSFAVPDAAAPMSGQYTVNGNRLSVVAAGTKNGKPIHGEMGCQVVVTHTRLVLKNEQGKTLTYRRAGE